MYIDSRVFAQKLLVAVSYSREQTLKKVFEKMIKLMGKDKWLIESRNCRDI